MLQWAAMLEMLSIRCASSAKPAFRAMQLIDLIRRAASSQRLRAARSKLESGSCRDAISLLQTAQLKANLQKRVHSLATLPLTSTCLLASTRSAGSEPNHGACLFRQCAVHASLRHDSGEFEHRAVARDSTNSWQAHMAAEELATCINKFIEDSYKHDCEQSIGDLPLQVAPVSGCSWFAVR